MVKQDKKRKILIQILCLLLSFGLWCYVNAIENPIGQKTIKNVSVEIVNTGVLAEDGLALAPNQHITVNLNIKGLNENIYNSSASDYKVMVTLGNSQLVAGSNWLTAQVVSSPQGVTIDNQQIKVNLKLEPLIKKEFTVQSNLDIGTEQGVYVKNIAFDPSAVMVEGASSAVNSVAKVVASEKIYNLNQDRNVNAKLVALNAQGQQVKDVDIYPGTVNAKISILNGKSVPINVVTTGTAPSGINIGSLTSDIKNVEVIGNTDVINNISSINTEPINLSNITSNTTIPVKLVIPSGVTIGKDVNSVNVVVTLANTNANTNNENNQISNSNNESDNKNQGSNNTNKEEVTTGNQVEKTFTVPIKMVGEKQGYKYTLSNNTVSVVLKGSQNDINNVNVSSLVSTIDVSNIETTANVKLNFKAGAGLSVVSFTPNEVTVTVTKDAGKTNSGASSNTGNNAGSNSNATGPSKTTSSISEQTNILN